MDAFQSELGCCGATGPADWTGSKYATKDPSNPVSLTVSEDANNEYKVPESCCKDRSSGACKADRKIKVAGVVRSAIYSEVISLLLYCIKQYVTSSAIKHYSAQEYFMTSKRKQFRLEISFS